MEHIRTCYSLPANPPDTDQTDNHLIKRDSCFNFIDELIADNRRKSEKIRKLEKENQEKKVKIQNWKEFMELHAKLLLNNTSSFQPAEQASTSTKKRKLNEEEKCNDEEQRQDEKYYAGQKCYRVENDRWIKVIPNEGRIDIRPYSEKDGKFAPLPGRRGTKFTYSGWKRLMELRDKIQID